MNISELKDMLQREGYREDSYCIGAPGARTECLCIEASGSTWRIYYAERGLRTGERFFDSEDEAASQFLEMVRADPTMRR